MWRVIEYDNCDFSPGDRVMIRSKSFGRSLAKSKARLPEIASIPQYIQDVYKDGRTKQYIYTVCGDYFLAGDLESCRGLYQLSFKFKG